MADNHEGSGTTFDDTLDQIVELVRKIDTFEFPEAPILGDTDDNVIAPNLETLLKQPDTAITTLLKDGVVVGFSLSIPIGRMVPSRMRESGETAYIYYVAIDPDHQKQGLAGPLMGETYRELTEHGYKYAEGDFVLTDEWADKVERNLPPEAILKKHDHVKWPEIGPERFMRIELAKI